MVNKLVLVLLILLPLLHSCKQYKKNSATVQGQIQSLHDSELILVEILPGGEKTVGSFRTDKDGKFKYSFQPVGYRILELRKDDDHRLLFGAEPGEVVSVYSEMSNFQGALVLTGPRDSALFMKLNRLKRRAKLEVDSLSVLLETGQSNMDYLKIRKSLDSAYLALFTSFKKQSEGLILSNTGSLGALLLIDQSYGKRQVFNPRSDYELYHRLDSALAINYGHNDYYQSFHGRFASQDTLMGYTKNKVEGLMRGSKVPDISLPDQQNNIQKLSKLKGAVTLVYFWASWNEDSRKMNIELATIYEEMRSKGFEIVAVSFDHNLSEWKSAIQHDKAYWKNLNDREGMQSRYSSEYSLNKMPSLFLIDNTMKLISIQPNIRELKAVLMNKL